MTEKMTTVTKEAFEKKCYELYQLEWMMSHGYSLNDLYNAMLEYEKDMFAPGDFRASDGSLSYETEFSEEDLERAGTQAKDHLLFGDGFGGGMIWASQDKFLSAEYLDPDYMKWLFETQVDTEADKLKKLYRDYTGTDLESRHDLKVHTSAGVLKAYRTNDPGQPGICVMLEPAGFDTEIDMAFVSVYEDPGYATEGERPVDVAIMCYADPGSEDYTSKDIVKRENICQALQETVEYRLDTADSTNLSILEDIIDDVNSLGFIDDVNILRSN